jgi:hypothetical protein
VRQFLTRRKQGQWSHNPFGNIRGDEFQNCVNIFCSRGPGATCREASGRRFCLRRREDAWIPRGICHAEKLPVGLVYLRIDDFEVCVAPGALRRPCHEMKISGTLWLQGTLPPHDPAEHRVCWTATWASVPSAEPSRQRFRQPSSCRLPPPPCSGAPMSKIGSHNRSLLTSA